MYDASQISFRDKPVFPSFRVLIPALMLLALLSGGPARGDSAIRCHKPTLLGQLQAPAYGDDGMRIGSACFELTPLPQSGLRMIARIKSDAGARAVMRAEFAAADEPGILTQTQQSVDITAGDGMLIDSLYIDRLQGHTQCDGPKCGKCSTRLQNGDRVVNVPVNLLLAPIASGRVERVSFQTLVRDEESKSHRYGRRPRQYARR